ncbi:UPF0676 protein C1494.01-like [Mizuhopecten yessoensis]|uniref:UPF0676 protein C1494.01-like n=1 Tax=Mizuhopecten yessoensis TaxID=6573 RepID=UPI000B45A630|nr:UPF0676 protein C1494.01-like [Mizuhopecten yessoensis]
MSVYGLDVVSENAVERETVQSVAEDLCGALSDVGFCYIKNHGIPQSLIDKMHAANKTFFEMPVEYKNAYLRPRNGQLHGWVPFETETINAERTVDYKEGFNYMPADNIELWPDVENFESSVKEVYNKSHQLALRILDLVSIGLKLEDGAFLRKCHKLISQKGNTTLMRNNYYPTIPKDKAVNPKQARFGEHSDYGTLTLLYQDNVSGLEIRTLEGEYIPIAPIPDTVLINIGDLMQRWSSDKLIATKHRVLIPDHEDRRRKVRQSTAFFIVPDEETMIECLDNSKKYEPVSSKDYLTMMLKPTY